MHKIPLMVFKILALSIVLMFVLDTTLVAVETINIHSKVSNLAGIMSNEIARNNCMPDALKTMFEGQMDDIIDGHSIAVGYDTNMDGDRIVENKTYYGLEETKARNYGEIAELYICITLAPTRVYFNVGEDRNTEGFLKKGTWNYNLTYTYSVPCLRYLK